MKKNPYRRTFYLPFILWWALLVGCYQGQPEKSNPFEAGDPFNLKAAPSYGQVHLSWQTPANLEGKQPIFQIDRKLSNTNFSLLADTNETTFIDTEIYQEATYRVSAFSGDIRSEFSEKSVLPFPTPHEPVEIRENGEFKRGIQSNLHRSWIYVLIGNKAQVKIFDISSSLDLKWQLNSETNDFAIAGVNDTEYILAATSGSVELCKVEGNNLMPLPNRGILLQYRATALTSSSPNDSSAYVALHQIEGDSVYIFKINFLADLAGKIIQQRRLIGSSITFMAFNQAYSQLFLLSATSNKIFLLDKNLTMLDSVQVGTRPNNIAFSPDSRFIFVCCQESEKIYSFKIDGGSFIPTEALIKRESANERFRWIDVAPGEAFDILLFNLVYDQSDYWVDIYRASSDINDVQKIRRLKFSQGLFLADVNSASYIREPEQKIWNLYIFAKNRIYYFLP